MTKIIKKIVSSAVSVSLAIFAFGLPCHAAPTNSNPRRGTSGPSAAITAPQAIWAIGINPNTSLSPEFGINSQVASVPSNIILENAMQAGAVVSFAEPQITLVAPISSRLTGNASETPPQRTASADTVNMEVPTIVDIQVLPESLPSDTRPVNMLKPHLKSGLLARILGLRNPFGKPYQEQSLPPDSGVKYVSPTRAALLYSQNSPYPQPKTHEPQPITSGLVSSVPKLATVAASVLLAIAPPLVGQESVQSGPQTAEMAPFVYLLAGSLFLIFSYLIWRVWSSMVGRIDRIQPTRSAVGSDYWSKLAEWYPLPPR